MKIRVYRIGYWTSESVARPNWLSQDKQYNEVINEHKCKIFRIENVESHKNASVSENNCNSQMLNE